MIAQVKDAKRRTRFANACRGLPVLDALLPLDCALFRNSQPWRFYAGPTLALELSGSTAWLAGHTLQQLPEGFPLWLLQLLIGLLTTAFSLAISHVGATIIMVPIAINVALAAGGNPTAFALIVALSASNNLMTASNPVMSMITGPANYSARDMWRVGGPLSLLYLLVIVAVINLLY